MSNYDFYQNHFPALHMWILLCNLYYHIHSFCLSDHFSFEVSQEALKRYDLEEEYSSDLDVEDRVYNYHIEYILKYMDQLKEEIENIKVK